MLKIFETVQAAYTFVWRERFNFISLAGLSVVATATISAISNLIVQSEVSLNASLLLTAMAFSAALLQLLFAIVWHRRYLVPDGQATFLTTYRAGLKQRRFIMLALIAYGFLSVIVGLLSPLIHFVTPLFVDVESDWFPLMVTLLQLPLFVPLGLLLARLSMLFPAAAVGQQLSVAVCWRATKGQAWPLLLILTLAVLPVSLVGWLLGYIAEGLAKLVSASDAMIGGYVGALVNQTFIFVTIATAATALSITYSAMVQPVRIQPENPAEPDRLADGHGYTAVIKLIAAAIVVGLIIGGLLFIAGFFGPLLLDPGSNQGPLLGFLIAPIGFLLGILLGLLWNARKAAKLNRWPRLIYFVFLAAFLVSSTTALSKYFFFHTLRLQVVEMLPSSLKPLAAPGGILNIWLVGVPIEKRQHIIDKELPIYVGGPLSELRGGWDVRFVDSVEFIKLHRQERARGQGPDIVVGGDYDLFTELLADPAFAHRLPALHHFAFRALGSYTYGDRDSRNFDLVRDLALSNDYCWRHGVESASQSLKTELGQLPTDLAVAFLTGDIRKLDNFSDPQRLRLKEIEMKMHDQPRIDFTQFCNAWGTPNLAFAEVFVNYESNQFVGRANVFLAMRKTPAGWRLLMATDNRKSINALTKTVPVLAKHMKMGGVGDVNPIPPALLAPNDGVDLTSLDTPASLEVKWKSSPSPNLIAEMVEMISIQNGQKNVRFSIYRRTRQPYFVNRHIITDQLPAEKLWRWRVWAIDSDGGLAFSKARSFRYKALLDKQGKN